MSLFLSLSFSSIVNLEILIRFDGNNNINIFLTELSRSCYLSILDIEHKRYDKRIIENHYTAFSTNGFARIVQQTIPLSALISNRP